MNTIKSLRIKILLGFSVVILLMVVMAVFSYSKVSSFNRSVSVIMSHDVTLLLADEKLSGNIQKRIALIRGYVLFGDPDYKKRFIETTEESKKFQEKLLATSTSQEAHDLVNKSIKWRELVEGTLFPAYDSGNKELALKILQNEVTVTGREIDEGFNKLAFSRESEIQVSGEHLLQNGNQLVLSIVILSAVAIIVGGFLALFIAQQIVGPIKHIAGRMAAVAEGDLTGKPLTVKTNDEIGRLLHAVNNMTENLRHIIQQVRGTSEQVAASAEELLASSEQTCSASEQIAATMQEIAIHTEREVQSADETKLTVTEMASHVKQIASNAQGTSSTATTTAVKAADGEQAIATASRQMQAIDQNVRELGDVVKGLSHRSLQIEDIVKEIAGISSQTNLLALNAAIEAAKAGEQGRGFAVVATEVRKLAEQSALSAMQITDLINLIQTETAQAVQAMENTCLEVTQGLQVVATAGQSFQQIESSIQDAKMQIEGVSAAVLHIAAGAEQMVEAMLVSAHATGTIAASAQEASASTEEQLAAMEDITSSATQLTAMAEQMQGLISRFQV
ncbi:hypothetical protein A8709_11110 [Paenibacillus pectinilyticus]|uniref:Chemotaxis protein n=1 Tax=Paenibacillus pectinilyticus TaxID=512399 RepID=A0A1C1A2G1_9BACL|nr:methyl-accepting chemotaxis protein [Paenibacillus pectinilyticus]OCT14724.1 hypothetical protein A8709_11110 [Paenibacillus pectinilyticus]